MDHPNNDSTSSKGCHLAISADVAFDGALLQRGLSDARKLISLGCIILQDIADLAAAHPQWPPHWHQQVLSEIDCARQQIDLTRIRRSDL